jgi:hypothetical protein
MKIRTGFVSNSSSASFTLIWRVNRWDDEREELTSDKAVENLLNWDSEKFVEIVKKHTKKADGKNTFISNFWTCMLNTESDIGADAMSLYFTLAMRQKDGNLYEIIHTDLKKDY